MATSTKTSKPSRTPVSEKSKAPADAAAKSKLKPAKAKTGPAQPISSEHRRHYIELAAFYIAERRGFSGGKDNALEDWLQAEAEIDLLLQQGKINR